MGTRGDRDRRTERQSFAPIDKKWGSVEVTAKGRSGEQVRFLPGVSFAKGDGRRTRTRHRIGHESQRSSDARISPGSIWIGNSRFEALRVMDGGGRNSPEGHLKLF